MENVARIDSIKTMIGNYEKRKEALKEEYRRKYEEDLSVINATITQLKIELADIVLSQHAGNVPSSEDLATFVSVKFNDKGKTYDYLWDSQEAVVEGDTVEVESRWHGTQEAEVVKVFKETFGYRDYNYKSAYPVQA